MIIWDQSVEFKPCPNTKQFNEQAVKILISPKQNESNQLTKWYKLAFLAVRETDWVRIAEQIIQSVRNVLIQKSVKGMLRIFSENVLSNDDDQSSDIDYQQVAKVN